MNGPILVRIREKSDRAARAKVAQVTGELILNDCPAAVELDFTRRYFEFWLKAFTFYTALELSGNDRNAAREVVLAPEIQDEISARVKALMTDFTGAQ